MWLPWEDVVQSFPPGLATGCHNPARLSDQEVFLKAAGRAGRSGSVQILTGWVGSGQGVFTDNRSSRVTPIRSDPRAVIRPVESPVFRGRLARRSHSPHGRDKSASRFRGRGGGLACCKVVVFCANRAADSDGCR